MTEQLTRADIAEMLDTLRTTAAAVSTTAASVSDIAVAITEQNRRTKIHRWLLGFGGAVLTAVVIVTGSTRAVIGVIEDCTKSTGSCYQDNVKRGAANVGLIIEEQKRTQRVVCDSIDPQRRPADCPPR